jgi:trk system potassium uptake protein TrkH
MPLFDAIGNSYATVATGGFSMHDASIAYYHSDAIDLIATFFMLASGVNFALHFMALRGGNLRLYFKDPEFRGYLYVIGIMIGGITLYLWLRHTYSSLWDSFIQTAFQVASMSTSTGFTTASFDQWPGFVPVLLILIGFKGACAGSTTGGIKSMRIHLMFKEGVRGVKRLIHPSAAVPLKIGQRAVSDRVIEDVLGFFAIYVLVFVILFLMLLGTDLDQVSAFSGLATCMNGVGPGLGKVATNFRSVSDTAKWVFVAGMLLGRLEIYPLLVLFTPAFWRR